MNNQTKFVYDRIIKNDKIKSILNIGFRHDSDLTLLNHAYAENKKWKVIEIYKPNVDNMIKLGIDATCMELYGNVYEKHISVLYPEQFKELGYEIFDHTPEEEKTFSAWTEK